MYSVVSSLSVLIIYIVLLNLECKSHYFGLDCKERCSSHCKNNEPCDHISGECPGGCQDGYMEEYCNSCKKPSLSLMTFYTLNCLFLQKIHFCGLKLAKPDGMEKTVLMNVL